MPMGAGASLPNLKVNVQAVAIGESSGEPQARFMINGQGTKSLGVQDEDKVGDTYILVREIILVH